MAFSVFGSEDAWLELFQYVLGRNVLLTETANLLEQSTNVEICSRSAIMLQRLIDASLAVYTESQIKGILLTCLRNEDDENVFVNLCRMITKAFDVFGIGVWRKHFPFVLGRDVLKTNTASVLEQLTNVDIRFWRKLKLIEEPLEVYTEDLVKDILLRRVEKENDRIVRKSLCHTIVIAFNVFCRENGWPELFLFIDRSVAGRNAYLQESAAQIIGSLYFDWTDHPMISLTEYFTCLKNADSADVRIAAFGAAISCLQCTPSFMIVDLVPVMIQMLTEWLKRGEEVTTQEALKLLIKWAHKVNMLRHSWGFTGMHLVGFVKSAFEIAESQSLEKETRHLAIDFVITLEEGLTIVAGKMRVEFPDASNRLFGILMLMLSAIACHLAENEDDDAGESINFSVVLEFLNRLAVKDNTSVCFVLREYLAASEWQKRVAAILVVAHIHEVYLKAIGQSFDQLVTLMLDLFEDPHPHVRLAAINATGQLSTKLDPNLQLQYHRHVLPALATAIYDFQYQRVQARAVSAMVNISKNFPTDITPYLHGTLSTLLQNDLASDQTKRPTIKLLRQFRQELPTATWASTWRTLHPSLQVTLISFLWEEF